MIEQPCRFGECPYRLGTCLADCVVYDCPVEFGERNENNN